MRQPLYCVTQCIQCDTHSHSYDCRIHLHFMSTVMILDFLEMATKKVEGYTASTNENDSDRDSYLKEWLMDKLKDPIDIRTPAADFKKIVLSIGIEAGYKIKRGEIDPKDKSPELPCPLSVFAIPESGRELMGDLYKEASKILEKEEASGKRTRI